ncbi:transketolase [Paenibacillus sp. PvR052]|nr:transketolase [Paenibacillus sp. PvP091]MBP1168844.1 transketolase [Paenibacillus sp. PvR098]MBP2439872.1 transketolase [Paenibacillus sp. PvP052]
MTSIAAGFASLGFTPFVSAFAMFQALRAGDNIRNGIAYPLLNVKIVSANISVHVGKNGATHHALEDIAIMRSIPNMTVVSPADANSTRRLIRQVAEMVGPVYVRLDKVPIPVVYGEDEPVNLGKGKILRTGKDVAILATGSMVSTAVEASKQLTLQGITSMVIDIHTIKPLDEEVIISCARTNKAIVTVEPHSIIGGLGGAVSELLGNTLPVPIERVGIRDRFTESGLVNDLNHKYGLTVQSVVQAVEKVLERKKQHIK